MAFVRQKKQIRRRTSGGVFFWVVDRLPLNGCSEDVKQELKELMNEQKEQFKQALGIERNNGYERHEIGDKLLGRSNNALDSSNYQ